MIDSQNRTALLITRRRRTTSASRVERRAHGVRSRSGRYDSKRETGHAHPHDKNQVTARQKANPHTQTHYTTTTWRNDCLLTGENPAVRPKIVVVRFAERRPRGTGHLPERTTRAGALRGPIVKAKVALEGVVQEGTEGGRVDKEKRFNV